jgi:hypothetical protein
VKTTWPRNSNHVGRRAPKARRASCGDAMVPQGGGSRVGARTTSNPDSLARRSSLRRAEPVAPRSRAWRDLRSFRIASPIDAATLHWQDAAQALAAHSVVFDREQSHRGCGLGRASVKQLEKHTG